MKCLSAIYHNIVRQAVESGRAGRLHIFVDLRHQVYVLLYLLELFLARLPRPGLGRRNPWNAVLFPCQSHHCRRSMLRDRSQPLTLAITMATGAGKSRLKDVVDVYVSRPLG